MSSPFVGEIRPFAFNFAPRGWAFCNGQLLSIAQNTALFSLLGTFYGGNGTSTFALPNLQSRVPIKFGTDSSGNSYFIGEQGGEETITLLQTQMPQHTHTFSGTSLSANDKQPVAGSIYATSNAGTVANPQPGANYYAATPNTTLNPQTVGVFGTGTQPHTNLQPYLTINWCIAMQGIYPARN